jgi:hypothetical protein
MKYTRYDYKKKKNDSVTLLIVLVSVLVVAFLLGTGIMTLISQKGTSGQNVSAPESAKTSPSNKEQASVVESSSVRLVAIQTGVFKNKENAETLKNKLKEQVIPFTIVEGDNIKILGGIFSEEDGAKVQQALNEKQIQNAKIVFEINKGELCDAEIAEIAQGYIKILSKLKESNVTAVQTDDFKKWISTSLKPVEANSKNYAVLDELKKYIEALPQEIGKDKVEENYVFLYNTLKKATGK